MYDSVAGDIGIGLETKADVRGAVFSASEFDIIALVQESEDMVL